MANEKNDAVLITRLPKSQKADLLKQAEEEGITLSELSRRKLAK